MAIYQVEGGFVISSQGCWLPGSYADERAANYAFRFPDDRLKALQDAANEANGGTGGRITYEALQDEALRAKGG